MSKSLFSFVKFGAKCAPFLGALSLLGGCDLFSSDLFSSSSVNTIGSRYDNSSDLAYCQELRDANLDNAYDNCLRQRRYGGRIGGDHGPSGCVEGGPLDHKSVCTTRTDRYGQEKRECVEIPNCRRPEGDRRHGFYPSSEASLSENIKGLTKQTLRSGIASIVESSSTSAPTVAETLRSITPEKMVITDGMSLASAKIVRSAVLSAFEGNSSELARLGFTEDELEGLLARNDITAASIERYNEIAAKLDMPGSTLKAFVSMALGVVIDTRWEVYNQNNPTDQ